MDTSMKNELDKLPDGFLKDYITFIIKHCPTSYEWAEAQALTLVSLAAGMDKFVHTKMGDISMHMYFLNCGPSRIAYKSLPMRNYTKKIIRRLSWLIGKDLLAPKRFSVEGMIDWFTPKPDKEKKTKGKRKKSYRKGVGGRPRSNKNNISSVDIEKEEITTPNHKKKKEYLPSWSNEGIMIYDEFSAIFKDTKNKQYMSDVLEFLSELDEGEIDKRKTITHGIQGDGEIFFGILSATTPDFFTSIDKGFFRQGTGNKFYYIMSEPQEIHREYEDDDDLEAQNFVGLMSGYSSQDRKSQLNEFADRVYAIRTKAPSVMEFTPSAARLVWHYYNDNHSISISKWKKDWKDLRYSFYSQRSVSMMKLAGLYTLSKNEANVINDKISKEEGVLVITESSIKWAIHRMDVYTEEFNKLLDMWPQAISSEEKIRTLDGYFAAIESIIRRSNNKVSLSDLKLKSGLGNTKFKEIINTMLSTGRIFGIKADESLGGSKGGAKPTIYSLSPFIENDEITTD